MTCGHETKQDWCPICTTRDDLLAKIARLEEESLSVSINDLPDRDSKISELQAALNRISNDYLTSPIEGEEEWKWLDRELTATKDYAKQHASK